MGRLRDYGDILLVLLGIKSREAMKDKKREKIRQRIIAGRCQHDVTARIIKHAMANYDYWEHAAVAQIMSIYKVGEKNACAIVSEMTGDLRIPKATNYLVAQIREFYNSLDKQGT